MSGLANLAVVLGALPLVVLVILLPFFLTLGVAAVVLGVPKFAVMMFKSLRRNLVRTSLTYLATFTGVIVVAMIWSVLSFLDRAMTERAKDVKVIVSEKFQIPSQMPP